MAYTNSPLATYTLISPNSTNPRNHKIDTITIHHVAGVCSAKTIARIFQPTERQASCNYAIGNDGEIALVVEEKNRSWCTSSRDNDHRAITFEVSNSATGGNWPVSDAALESTINLCVDICKRNGIERLNFTGDKSGNLTMHKWFAATACPGPYLESKFPYIADEVNRRLGVGDAEIAPVVPTVPTEQLLSRGCVGTAVKQLQEDLIELGYGLSKYGADSDFGGETEEAVIKFQKDNNLVQDGIVGPETQKMLTKKLEEKRNAQKEVPSSPAPVETPVEKPVEVPAEKPTEPQKELPVEKPAEPVVKVPEKLPEDVPVDTPALEPKKELTEEEQATQAPAVTEPDITPSDPIQTAPSITKPIVVKPAKPIKPPIATWEPTQSTPSNTNDSNITEGQKESPKMDFTLLTKAIKTLIGILVKLFK